MRKNLTDATMRALDPGYTWDMKLPGFGVYRGTYRTTFVTIRNGKRSKLGLYPYMSLAEARKAAVLGHDYILTQKKRMGRPPKKQEETDA